MWLGIGVGIGRQRFVSGSSGIFSAYAARVAADGGATEAGGCVDAVSGLLLNASLLLVPSGYKGGKLYAEIPTNGNGDLTWTRGSDGFRTNASGLIQRVPWNLLQQSENFPNAVWGKSTLTFNSTVTAPNGTSTAQNYSTAGAFSYALQTVSVVSGQYYTSSCYLKYTSGVGSIAIRYTDGTSVNFISVTANLINGTIGSVSYGGNGANGTATITSVGDGWYRVTVSGTLTIANAGFIVSNLGLGATTFSIWGAQLVEGTTAQTYLPTTDRLNFPRLSYMYGSCPSLLLEPQRTNLALWSEDLTQTAWAKTNSGTITANSTISPDGTQTADTLNAGANSAQAQQAQTGTSGAVYTVSIWVKRITGTGNVFLRAVENADTLIAVTSDWQRFTATVTSTSTTIRVGVKLATSGDEVAIWGGQIELGAYPTTYIPTTSATATRVADSFSRSNIYTNGLITASGGTWFVELRGNLALTRDGGSNNLILSDAVGTTYFRMRNSGATNSRLLIQKGIVGTSTDLFQTTTDTVKIAIKWNGSTADVFVNGTKQVSATAFTATQLQDLQGIPQVSTFIQQMALYPTPLTDTQCQTLTTL